MNKQELPLKWSQGTSLAVPWLRLHFLTAGGVGSISGWGTKTPHAAKQHSQSFKNGVGRPEWALSCPATQGQLHDP